MQLVSREQLFALAKGRDVVEAEGTFSFDEFVAEWSKTYAAAKKDAKRDDDAVEWTYKDLKKGWLREHKDLFKLVGEGSSRAAFAFPGGKCLKIATNKAGLAQNAQEAKNVGYSEETAKYSCFAMNYAYDKKTRCALVTECCSKIGHRDFQQLFGMTSLSFTQTLQTMFSKKNKSKDMKGTLKFCQNACQKAKDEDIEFLASSYERAIAMAEEIIKNKAPQWQIARDLARFYFDNGIDALIASDLIDLDNWGLAVRNGKVVPVIVDSGFSEKVYSKYY